LEWWRGLASGSDAVYACEELAKHYEWHDVDLAQAIRWVERGIELAQARTAGHKQDEAREGLDHRLARLRLKAGHTKAPA
jgi:20S proteasome alpha/beta subunit